MRDTGLLVSMLEEGTQKAILDNDLYINQGALLENVCAEEIATRHSKLMYFERKSTLEIDFVLNIDGKVTAIEVKSGKNKQAKSLKTIIQNYKTVTRYMKFENDCNIYKDEENIEHYPLFMIMFIQIKLEVATCDLLTSITQSQVHISQATYYFQEVMKKIIIMELNDLDKNK